MVHVKSEGCRGTAVREGGTWTVAYTNVDGLVSVMDEVNEFIKANEPDIMAMVETKLRDSETPNLGGGKYNMWIRNRCGKGGGGVMMLVKKGIRVESGKGRRLGGRPKLTTNKWKKRNMICHSGVCPTKNKDLE